jgi:hypothetical protein
MTVRLFSCAGDTQSVACVVLAARGQIDCRPFLFASVGDDGGYPEAPGYPEDHTNPYAAVSRPQPVEFRRGGEYQPLLAKLTVLEPSPPTPVPVDWTGPPGTGSTTTAPEIVVTGSTAVCGTVLDPFAGSGSTLLAGRDLSRRAIGIETRKDSCEAAVRRLAQGVLAA